MAIKGKSKSRSARAVTRGPKPAYQPVKKPLLAKRGFWLVTAGVLGGALLVGLIVGFIVQRNASDQNAVEARMRTAVAQFKGDVEPILTSVGQARPPSSYDVFTDLTTAVGNLQAEKPDQPVDAKSVRATATTAADSAKAALDALDQIDETALIRGKGFSEEFVLFVINAKGNFVRSMLLYRQAALLVGLAVDAQGAERAALADRAAGVLDVANEIFTRGYSDYVEAQTQAGVFQPTAPVAGLPVPSGTT